MSEEKIVAVFVYGTLKRGQVRERCSHVEHRAHGHRMHRSAAVTTTTCAERRPTGARVEHHAEQGVHQGHRLGAGVAHAGVTGIEWSGLNKTLIAIVLSPLLGMMLAMLIMLVSSWAFARATNRTAEKSFRALHLFSSAAYSVSHGLNDAQKTMGIITVLLY